MLVIGCDFHTRFQKIAMVEDSTGELLLERRLDHERGEAHAFYRNLSGTVRVGIEATGLSRGLLSVNFVKLGTGRHHEISPLIWVLSVLFLLRYPFLGSE